MTDPLTMRIKCRWEVVPNVGDGGEPLIPFEKRLIRDDTYETVRTVRLNGDEIAELQQGKLPL